MRRGGGAEGFAGGAASGAPRTGAPRNSSNPDVRAPGAGPKEPGTFGAHAACPFHEGEANGS